MSFEDMKVKKLQLQVHSSYTFNTFHFSTAIGTLYRKVNKEGLDIRLEKLMFILGCCIIYY